MAIQPKLEIRQYHGDGKYDYAIFRADRIRPICAGISKAHANHLKIILGKMPELPDTISPIKDWYDYDYIVPEDAL